MRKSRTVHLEEDFWREMDEYKEVNTCGSRNTALERMLLERRMLIGLIQQLGLPGAVGNMGQMSFGAPVASSQPSVQPMNSPVAPPQQASPKIDKKEITKRSIMKSAKQGMPDG